METCKPFIKMLRSPLGFYFFDVNRNEIVSTTEEVYGFLCQILDSDENEVMSLLESPRLKAMTEAGYLLSKHPKKIRHSQTDYLDVFLTNRMEKITLQLTQNCNFRCTYCAYTDTGGNRQRLHSNSSMSYETAIKAVDFLYEHSKDSKRLNIGFYGGEPLLEFDLLQKIVTYADDLFAGRELTYTMTTNGSLLTREVADYCTLHKIPVMVSLDGPKEVHDKNRKLAGTNQGTFDLVIERLEQVKKTNPEFVEQIRISMVVDPTADYDCYGKLYMDYDTLEKEQAMTSFVDTEFTGLDYSSLESFDEKQRYDVFLAYLSHFNRVGKEHVSPIVLREVNNILADRERMQRTASLSDTMCPGGPCMPGVLRTLVDVNGDLFPCERCSETSQVMKIGTLDDGFDLEKAKYILNVGNITEEECKNCWAITHCTICAARVEDGERICPEKKLTKCNMIKAQTESKLLSMIMLKEVPHYYPDL